MTHFKSLNSTELENLKQMGEFLNCIPSTNIKSSQKEQTI